MELQKEVDALNVSLEKQVGFVAKMAITSNSFRFNLVLINHWLTFCIFRFSNFIFGLFSFSIFFFFLMKDSKILRYHLLGWSFSIHPSSFYWLTCLLFIPVLLSVTLHFHPDIHETFHWRTFFFFPKQLSPVERESQKKQQYGMVQELLRESNRLREEFHNLKCLRRIKAEERGQKHCELLRTEVRTQINLRRVQHISFHFM